MSDQALGDAGITLTPSTFNEFRNAARTVDRMQRSGAGNPQQQFRQADIVLVKNESGAARNRFDILGIEGPIFGPSDNLREFKNRVTFRGVVPTDPHRGRFVILLEPAATGTIASAYVAGVCPVQVELLSAADTAADIIDGDASKLRGSSGGAAQILWADIQGSTFPQTQWCTVRLGAPSSPMVRVIALTPMFGQSNAAARVTRYDAQGLVGNPFTALAWSTGENEDAQFTIDLALARPAIRPGQQWPARQHAIIRPDTVVMTTFWILDTAGPMRMCP